MKHIKISKKFSLQRLLEWQVLLFIIAIVLVPKFPLIPTNSSVPIRYDDFFIIPPLLTSLIIIYKNKSWRATFSYRLTKIISLWLGVLLLATVIGILRGGFDSPAVPFLFWLRYVQYFSIFFVGVAVLTSSKDLSKHFLTLVGLIIPIGIYAIGQRLGIWGGYGGAFYNYQFLPGVDRAFATFAGPYELAAYLVLTIPIVASISLYLKNIWKKLLWLSVFLISTLALSYTAARTPIASVFVGMGVLTIFIPSWKRRVWIIGLAVFLLVVPFILSDTLAARSREFLATVQSAGRNIIYNNSQPITVPPSFESEPSPTESKPGATTSQPKLKEDTSDFFSVVLGEEGSTTTYPTSPEAPTKVSVEPSLKWRVDNLWPQAIDKFKNNPLTGGGLYSSGISVDSTYLTLLGETGIVGLILFLWVMLEIFKMLINNIRRSEGLNKLLLIGFLGGTVALLANAVFIDVFRASKIAYIFWLLVGLSLKYSKLKKI